MTLKDRLTEVEEHICASCARAHRDRSEVTLIGVSKTHPAETAAEGVRAGLKVLGENRVQELKDKVPEVARLLPGADIAWHLIGTLQTNKVKYLAPMRELTMIHSVDSAKLAAEIEKQFAKEERVIDVLIEVNMAAEETKAGLAPEDVRALLKTVAPMKHLRVRGLMTIAPFTEEAESNRVYFRGLKELMLELNRAAILASPMTELSMGMSGDYPVAIEEGATFVRVGTAIFGAR